MRHPWLSTEDDRTWHITLDRYERDNLLQLLNAVGYPYPKAQRIEPLAPFNNGDWVGQIALKLMRTDGSHVLDEHDRPNVSYEQIVERMRGG